MKRSIVLRRLPQPASAHRLARFGVVGVIGMVINTAILWLLAERAAVPVLTASVVATETAIISNFWLNDRWTFRAGAAHGPIWRRFLRFNGVALGGMLITVVILALLHTYTRLALPVANVVAIAVATIWNYIVNSRWTWRGAHAATAPSTASEL